MTVKDALDLTPLSRACLAMLAALDMSSYELFVQLPIQPTFTSGGQPFLTASSPSLSIGLAKSGVNGPLTCGLSFINLMVLLLNYFI